MYGSYSFINIAFGGEESTDGYSMRNIMEVAVIAEVVASLYKGKTYLSTDISVKRLKTVELEERNTNSQNPFI